ncbi:MAG: NUDIX domain-containing protein [Clostridia bacterium]|nr:NUDIX domain-containing protein [Clostridia bacterium]
MDYIHDLRRLTGPRKLILNAADALIVREGKILFQRRADNGKWGLIGGLLELNETYEEAAIREIREETGLEVKLESFLGIFHNHDMVWPNGDRAHVISACYTASIVRGEPRIDEESFELRFFGKDEIPPLFAQDHIEELKAYFSGVRYPLLRENRDLAK